MEQKIGTLTLTNYDNNDKLHRKFKRDLINDPDFQKYFGEMFIKNNDEIFKYSNKIEIKKAYLMKDNDKIVGMIRIYSYHSSGVVNIQYAVSPEYRNQGYGTKILKEISDFLLANNIKCIEGDIDKNNIGSIKVATKLGYIKEEDKYKKR